MVMIRATETSTNETKSSIQKLKLQYIKSSPVIHQNLRLLSTFIHKFTTI